MMLNNHVTCSYMFIPVQSFSYIVTIIFPHSMDLTDGIAPSVRHTPKWLTASLRATWMESCARSLQLWHLLRLTLWWKFQNGWEKPRRNGRFSWENHGKWMVIWENLWTQWASVNSSECRNVVNCMPSDSQKVIKIPVFSSHLHAWIYFQGSRFIPGSLVTFESSLTS